MSDCILWKGAINSSGYGHRRVNKEAWLAHRYVFFQIHGYKPLVVRHTCDNKLCINPEHLLGGNMLDNMKDAKERGRLKR